jgi:hypothetical protein
MYVYLKHTKYYTYEANFGEIKNTKDLYCKMANNYFILLQGWARNFQNAAPQKQNTIYKLKAQNAICYCAFKLFKAHCAASSNAKNANFHNRFLSAKMERAIQVNPHLGRFRAWIFRLPSTGLDHYPSEGHANPKQS